MTEDLENTMESVAGEIKAVVSDRKVNTFLSFFYTADVLNKYLNDEIRQYGHSRTSMDVLNTLIRHGGTMTPTKLSKRVFRSKNTITKTVDTLEKEGLVKREGWGEDRRTTRVTITSKGLQEVKQTMPSARYLGYTALSCLDEGSIEQLNASLKQVRQHLLSLMEGSARRRK